MTRNVTFLDSKETEWKKKTKNQNNSTLSLRNLSHEEIPNLPYQDV